jgi:hypothetical protein
VTGQEVLAPDLEARCQHLNTPKEAAVRGCASPISRVCAQTVRGPFFLFGPFFLLDPMTPLFVWELQDAIRRLQTNDPTLADLE